VDRDDDCRKIAMTIVENVRLSRHAGRVRRDVRSWR